MIDQSEPVLAAEAADETPTEDPGAWRYDRTAPDGSPLIVLAVYASAFSSEEADFLDGWMAEGIKAAIGMREVLASKQIVRPEPMPLILPPMSRA